MDLDVVLFGDLENEVEPLAVGAISEPQFGQDAVFIIKKLAGPEEHEFEFKMLRQLVNVRVDEWHSEQLSRGSSEGWLTINFDSDRYAWVADQVNLTKPRVEQPKQDQQGGLPVGGQ